MPHKALLLIILAREKLMTTKFGLTIIKRKLEHYGTIFIYREPNHLSGTLFIHIMIFESNFFLKGFILRNENPVKWILE